MWAFTVRHAQSQGIRCGRRKLHLNLTKLDQQAVAELFDIFLCSDGIDNG